MSAPSRRTSWIPERESTSSLRVIGNPPIGPNWQGAMNNGRAKARAGIGELIGIGGPTVLRTPENIRAATIMPPRPLSRPTLRSPIVLENTGHLPAIRNDPDLRSTIAVHSPSFDSIDRPPLTMRPPIAYPNLRNRFGSPPSRPAGDSQESIQPTLPARPASPPRRLFNPFGRARSISVVPDTTQEDGQYRSWGQQKATRLGQRDPSTGEAAHVADLTSEVRWLEDVVRALSAELKEAQALILAQKDQDELQRALLASFEREQASKEPMAQPGGRATGIMVHQQAGPSEPPLPRIPTRSEPADLTQATLISDDEHEPVTANGIKIKSHMHEALADAARRRADQGMGNVAPPRNSAQPSVTAGTRKEDLAVAASTLSSHDKSKRKAKASKLSKSSKKRSRRDSTSSSSTLDESSDEEEERREQRRKAMKALAIGRPKSYNGEADYERLEAWLEDVLDWREAHALTEYAQARPRR